MQERKLASIQIINDIQSIEGADFIEMVKCLGWQLVTKKGEFNKFDLCVFFEIDSILPNIKWCEFLGENRRLKTRKFKGQISQGLALPLSILSKENMEMLRQSDNEIIVWKKGDKPNWENPLVGRDVTALLEVTKYEPPMNFKSGNAKGNFPSHIGIKKTDEVRIQSEPKILEEIKGKSYYITQKIDGTSFTAYVDPNTNEFEVASHNFLKKKPEEEKESCVYWKVAQNIGLEKKLLANSRYCIQGECAGNGIQGNKLGIFGLKLFVFNIYDLLEKKYLDFNEFIRIASYLDLETVPVLEVGDNFQYTINDLLVKAEGCYSSGNQQEGIVVRTQKETWSNILKDRLSFKVVNNKFLLKYRE